MAPLNEGGDRVGCKWVDEHTVTTPPGFKEAYQSFMEGGWQALAYPPKYGGGALPYSLALVSTEMHATANWSWTMYPGLSKGAINTVLAHGDDAMKCVCRSCSSSRWCCHCFTPRLALSLIHI